MNHSTFAASIGSDSTAWLIDEVYERAGVSDVGVWESCPRPTKLQASCCCFRLLGDGPECQLLEEDDMEGYGNYKTPRGGEKRTATTVRIKGLQFRSLLIDGRDRR